MQVNAGREAIDVVVTNTGDRPVQVGSHFEPGDSKTVRLLELAGRREVYGLSNAVNGALDPIEGARK